MIPISELVEIGSMVLKRQDDGFLYLSNTSEEAMQVNEADLEKVLMKYFKENF